MEAGSQKKRKSGLLWHLLFFLVIVKPFVTSAQAPVVNFSADVVSGCTPLVVKFTDLSTNNPTSWSWDLGVSTSTIQNPTATFLDAGTYTIKLTATNSNGTNTVTKTGYITIYALPNVDFSTNDTLGCAPLTVRFTDLSDAAIGTLTKWEWNFGDGGTSLDQNPRHVYTHGGKFGVFLKATNSHGCSKVGSKAQYIKVADAVKSSFTSSAASYCSYPIIVNFKNTSEGEGALSYLWRFGDGATSAEANPSHSYNSGGNFAVSLITTNAAGCSDTSGKTLNLSSRSTSFTSPSSLCIGSTGAFSVSSNPTPVSAIWNMGDGTIYSGLVVNHAYRAAGSYVITMKNDYGGCTDSVSKTVVVTNAAVIDFSAPVTGSCSTPFTINFEDRSQGMTKWFWEFGDGSTSTEQNPRHTYRSGGKFTVRLTAENGSGCKGTKEKPDFITALGASSTLTNVPASGCVPFMFSPTYASNYRHSIVSFAWDFGDGNTSTEESPSHTYTSTGSYTVSLSYVTKEGCRDSVSVTNAVKVGDSTKVDFNVSSPEICGNSRVFFTPIVSVPVTSYSWDFGDGASSTDREPSHKFVDTGYQSIKLAVRVDGCLSIVSKQAVKVNGPVARFTYTKDCINQGRVSFFNKTISGSSVLWDFGDGSAPSSEEDPIHVYTAAGRYLVRLYAVNSSCSDTASQTIPVWFGSNTLTGTETEICKGGRNVITLTHPNPGYVVSYNWNITGNRTDSFVTTSNSILNHVYQKAGTFGIIAYTIDSFGCRDTVIKPRFIVVKGPTANFGVASNSGCSGNTFNITDSSATDGVNPIRTWSWNFGDGAIKDFTSGPFTHIYSAAGSYDVKLKVTDAAGCTDTVTRLSFITVAEGKANFGFTDSFACPGSELAFFDSSLGNIVNYKWDFGDGNTSTAANPVHRYSQAGVYSVKLAISVSGCTDSTVRNNLITVNSPQARFVTSDTGASCPPVQTKFTDSSFYAKTWRWTFDDGNSSSLQHPFNVFFTPKVYKVKLLITSPGGCQDSAFKNIIVTGPIGNLSYRAAAGCAPVPISFKATDVIGALDYLWDYGDGLTSSSTDSSSSHAYTDPGKYIPRVLMKDEAGCVVPYQGKDTIVVDKVVPAFSVSARTICDSGHVIFTDSTKAVTATTNRWSFGDGATSAERHPNHRYTSTGTYDVKLVVQSILGCTDSLSYPAFIKVVRSPEVIMVADDSTCEGSRTSFATKQSPGDTSKIISWLWSFANGNTSRLATPASQSFVAGIFKNLVSVINTSGCSSTITKTLNVFTLPNVQLTNDTTICDGTTAELKAAGAQSYSWSSRQPETLSCLDCATSVAKPDVNTFYKVKGTATTGCFNYDSVQVSVLKRYSLSAVPSVSLCIGSSVQLRAFGAPKYMWSPAAGLSAINISNPIASPISTTSFTVTGYDTLGCFTDSLKITANVFNYPTVELGADITMSAGNTTSLSSSVSPDVIAYRWTPPNDLSCTTCPNPMATPKRNEVYKLTVTNSGGCDAKDSIRIVLNCDNSSLFVPNTFSPNGDGMNDIFYPRGNGIHTIVALKIFNRWGEVIFDKRNFAPNDPQSGWNGLYKGKLADTGTYTYLIEVICTSSQFLKYFGNINLIQ